jgi:hypothetical protein
MDRIDLAQGRGKYRALENKAMTHLIPLNVGQLLSR